MHTCIKDNNNSPHSKFHRCLFPFSGKSSPHMFSIFTHVKKPVRDTNSEPGLPVHLLEYHTPTHKWNYNDKLTDVINRAIRTSKKKKRTRCVIAGNRHYILDLKHNKSSAFIFSYLSQTLKLQRNNKLSPYLPPKMLSLQILRGRADPSGFCETAHLPLP